MRLIDCLSVSWVGVPRASVIRGSRPPGDNLLFGGGRRYGVVASSLEGGLWGRIYRDRHRHPSLRRSSHHMVALLFGLSSDYEVFLSAAAGVRVGADVRDKTSSLTRGLAALDGLITAAATIMNRILPQSAPRARSSSGLRSGNGRGHPRHATTVIRMLLVPAVMPCSCPPHLGWPPHAWRGPPATSAHRKDRHHVR